jgi:hypothetical protein
MRELQVNRSFSRGSSKQLFLNGQAVRPVQHHIARAVPILLASLQNYRTNPHLFMVVERMSKPVENPLETEETYTQMYSFGKCKVIRQLHNT